MLKQLLTERKKEILKRWLSETLATYPGDAARFMQNEFNQFANPVGQTFAQEFEAIYEIIKSEENHGEISGALEKSLKIRAVQDFSASQAVAFVFFLKKAIREELADQIGNMVAELLALESRIDSVALHLFDRFMADREKLYSIRLNEARRSLARNMERFGANIVVEQPDKSRGSQDD